MSESPKIQPGDAVWTSYGAGVIVGERSQEHDGVSAFFYQVRLWRIPGKSIASSSLAYLTPFAILERLPAAPGMTTRLRIPFLENNKDDGNENDKVLVHSYYFSKRIFLVSPTANRKKEEKGHLLLSKQESSLSQQQQLQYVSADDLIPVAPSARVYPILEVLMHRAEQTAEATRHLLRSEQTQHWVDQTGRVVGEAAGRLLEQTQKQEANGGAVVEQLKTAAKEAAPQVDENFHQVLAIMKDEQLTNLLVNCRERLQELVKTADVSQVTRQVLQKTGIRIASGSTENNILPQYVADSRKAALSALDELLKQARMESLDDVKKELAAKFTTAFDSLSTAASSDRGLNELFQTVSEKTTAWQQVSGRLLQTRSAGLFLEGASRLQARAASILRKQGHLDWTGEIGSKLTKSFTEGDAAVARIKSIELGEAVKTKLIEAIEVRSESLGGLDGIIAGALATIDMKQKDHFASSNPIQSLLAGLQANATSATTDARETLISVLSSRSQYRDLVLIRLEHVLCHLEHQLGDTMTPEDIAAIARGDGGTKRIFEPIAKRAMEQIEKQLDTAESQVKDGSVQEVLRRVRKIMSGEMSPAAVMDEVVAILNDDNVVAAGETLVQHSEHVLDVLEGVSGNKAVSDALQIAERAGITKDSVMREIERLDVDVLIGTAGCAVTDERARRKLISSAIDAALDFALRVLPSMPVPPFEGVKDGLVYQISNLSMEGFRVRKEDIQIELAGMRASRKSRSLVQGNSSADGELSGIDAVEGLHNDDSTDIIEVQQLEAEVKATELLIIDIRNISAVLEDSMWSFEQTYMPYLKGDGKANVKMTGGAIRLQFELRRRQCPENDKKWEPVLCLHDRSCSIAEVELNLQGEGRLTWILNKLAAIFRGPLRDYVVRTIVRVLTNRSGWILRRLNDILSPYWDLILRTAKLNMADLMVADDRVVVEERKSVHDSLIELVWRESLPLGMNLLTNDSSGLLKVVDFPRGSQARLVCEKRNLSPDIFEGATIVAVNGAQFDDSEELFDALKEPGRPKTVRFKLAKSEELEKLRAFVDGGRPKMSEGNEQADQVQSRDFALREVSIASTGEIGIEFGTAIDNRALVVQSFLQHPDGIVFEAEKSGRIQLGDLLTHVNNESVVGKEGPARAIALLQEFAASRPLSLKFCEPYAHYVKIPKMEDVPGVDNSGGIEELVLKEVQTEASSKRVAIAGFKGASGMAESSGILIGDHLVFVNGAPVGAGCYWVDAGPSPSLDDIHRMLEDDTAYPIGLTFARPKLNDRGWNPDSQRGEPLRDDQAETICVTGESKERIGCVFIQGEYGNVTVSDFYGVAGVFQRSFVKLDGSKLPLPLSVDSLNGQFVPSYASLELVKNAMKRAWRSEGGIEMTLCDDELKAWIEQMTETDS